MGSEPPLDDPPHGSHGSHGSHTQNIIPSQIAIDAAQYYGGDPLDYCDICAEKRGAHDVSKRNYLIPCESDGEWSESENGM